MKNRIKILISVIIIVILLVIAGILIFHVYKNHQKQVSIDTSISAIQEQYTSFEDEDDRLAKLDMLTSLQTESDNYSSLENAYEDVISSYTATIKNMKSYFTDSYDVQIRKNSSSSKTTSTDLDVLNESLKNLEDELAVITIEKDIVLTEDEFSSYESKLNELITTYNDSISSLEKADKLAAYDALIEENTIDTDSATDNGLLSSAKEALASCLESIESDDLCNDDELAAYTNQVNELIASYESKISELEVAAAEAEEQAAKEEQNAAEEKKASDQKNSSSSIVTYETTTYHLKCTYNGVNYTAPDNVSSLCFDNGHTIHINIQETSDAITINWYDATTGILYDSNGNVVL